MGKTTTGSSIKVSPRIEVLTSLIDTQKRTTNSYSTAVKRSAPQHKRLIAQLLEDHKESLRILEALYEEEGGDINDLPTKEEGLGIFPSESTDPFFTKLLKTREEDALLNYEKWLGKDSLDAELKRTIRMMLIPRLRAHIPLLDQLLHSV